jgi:hypothetical protein
MIENISVTVIKTISNTLGGGEHRWIFGRHIQKGQRKITSVLVSVKQQTSLVVRQLLGLLTPGALPSGMFPA